jgi:isopentenyl phosphate kinase
LTELVFLKLGGSLITDKASPQKAKPEVIRRAAREIGAALDESRGLQLLLGHGSGSFGHPVARRYRIQEGLADTDNWWGYAQTAVVAAHLNRLVSDICLAEGIPVLPIQPSASSLCENGSLRDLEVTPLKEALRRRLVPVVYGDVSFDTARGSAIISTEEIYAYLAPLLHPSRVILATQVEGVFTADPLKEGGTALVREIVASELQEVEPLLAGSAATDVTGGMLGKVRTMCRLVLDEPRATVRIISGDEPGLIRESLLNRATDQGTLIHA